MLFCNSTCECEEFVSEAISLIDVQEQPVIIPIAPYVPPTIPTVISNEEEEQSAIQIILPNYFVYGTQQFNQFGRCPRNNTLSQFVPDVNFTYVKCGAVSCIFQLNGQFYAAGQNTNGVL